MSHLTKVEKHEEKFFTKSGKETSLPVSGSSSKVFFQSYREYLSSCKKNSIQTVSNLSGYAGVWVHHYVIT